MVISAGTRAQIDALKQKYPRARGALLPAMHLVQQESGHISPEIATELAQLFELKPVDVMEVVHFYTMFRAKQGGTHHVHVCTNLPCSLRGARKLMRGLEAHLGVESGETTKDGRITLHHEECLGACAYAPMMRIDGEYHEDLDLEEARRILDGLE
jgi:NADH-quinone oxidoreductase subunit E